MSCALLGSAGLSIRSPSVHRQVLGYERISCGFWLFDLPWLKNLSNMIQPESYHGVSTEEETGGKYLHCLVFLSSTRSFHWDRVPMTQHSLPWNRWWMDGIVRCNSFNYSYYRLIMLLFSEPFLQAPLANPNRVSPRNKQGPLPLCTLYGIIQYSTEYGTAYSTLRGFREIYTLIRLAPRNQPKKHPAFPQSTFQPIRAQNPQLDFWIFYFILRRAHRPIAVWRWWVFIILNI